MLNEGITNYPTIWDHIGAGKPGTMFTSGGSSLGWNGGAAIGMKLARPDKTVVVLSGDGSYMFRSHRRSTGWRAATGRRFCKSSSTIAAGRRPSSRPWPVHPDGFASRARTRDELSIRRRILGIAAAAGGAHAEVDASGRKRWSAALERALRAVREEGRRGCHRCPVAALMEEST